MFHRNVLGFILNEKNLLGSGVELGVQEGEFSEIILQTWQGKKLYLIDCWEHQQTGYIDVANVTDNIHEQYYQTTVNRTNPHKDRIEIIKKYSSDAINDFENESLDFVYIDANHKYEAVLQDINLWYPKIKKCGLLAGHDCIDDVSVWGMFGVYSAVNEFCKNNSLSYTTGPCKSWYIWK